jgi:hypothetical protein
MRMSWSGESLGAKARSSRTTKVMSAVADSVETQPFCMGHLPRVVGGSPPRPGHCISCLGQYAERAISFSPFELVPVSEHANEKLEVRHGGIETGFFGSGDDPILRRGGNGDLDRELDVGRVSVDGVLDLVE